MSALDTSNECTLVTQSEVDDTVPVAVVPVVYSSDSDAPADVPSDSAAGAPASSASKKRSLQEPVAEEGNKKARTDGQLLRLTVDNKGKYTTALKYQERAPHAIKVKIVELRARLARVRQVQ